MSYAGMIFKKKLRCTSAKTFLSAYLPGTFRCDCVEIQIEQKAGSWAASSPTETDSSTPLPVLPEGFSQVRFLALGWETENENLQIRSQGVVTEPDPGFSPQLDLWTPDLI